MEFKPHAYQMHCIEKILQIKKLGLFLDMGLGKTVTTLTAIRELKYNRFQVRKVLVIAPKKVAEGTWTREKDKWDHTKILRVSAVLGSQVKRIRALNTPADIYITNRENVAWLVDYYRNSWPFDMVVVDESSSFKSHKAKRFKSLASVGPHIERMVELTGTPSPNGLEDLWAQIYLLDAGERLGKRYTQFRERYFDPGDCGADVIYNYKAKPGSEESILQKISDICISMKAEDYLELPEISYHEIPVELDAKSRASYGELERKMVLELPEEEDEISVTSAAALSNKLLQLGNGAIYDDDRNYHEVHRCKIEAFMELVESLQGKPALVFYNFQHDKARILDALAKTRLRVRVLKNAADEDDWNAGGIDVLLAHPASSAYGLNLQQGGNHVVWFGLTWNYELYAQANKRLHRQGQKERVIVHHLVCTGTRDEDVMKALGRKDNVQEWVMESLRARIKAIRDADKKMSGINVCERMENKMAALKKWWEDITYQEAKDCIRESVQNLARDYIAVGYYLRYIRDNGSFTDDGYQSIHDFANAEFGMQKSTVNHCIRINAEFSEDGNSPLVDPKYGAFGKAQLQELLYVPEDKRGGITPDMTVAEIRKSRKPKRLDVEPEKNEPDREKPADGQSEKIIPEAVRQETEENSRGRKEAPAVNQEETERTDDNIDSDVDVIDVPYREEPVEVTVQGLLAHKQKELELWMSTLEGDPDIPPGFEELKIIVQALTLLAEQENINIDIPEEIREQPPLPQFKNNEQRKEWLRNYAEWGLWYEDEHIGVKYYRYYFDNGAELIVEEYLCKAPYAGTYTMSFHHLVGGPEPMRKGEIPKWQRHETYNRYPNSETELVEFLKFIQKEGKGSVS